MSGGSSFSSGSSPRALLASASAITRSPWFLPPVAGSSMPRAVAFSTCWLGNQIHCRHSSIASRLRLMKKSAFLINTARGPIVDEAALLRALKAKRIAGAGLDVLEHEPKVDAALRKLPNVALAPHLGSAVVETREEIANIVVDNILAFLDGKVPPNCVNPEVLRR